MSPDGAERMQPPQTTGEGIEPHSTTEASGAYGSLPPFQPEDSVATEEGTNPVSEVPVDPVP